MIFKLSSPFRLFAAAVRVLYARCAGYEVLVPDEVVADRLDVCERCEFLTEDRQCRVCTCFVDFKVKLALEECPKLFWRRIWKKKSTTLQ